MLGGVIILITYIALFLGSVVVAIIATAQVPACSTSLVIGPEAVRFIRSAPCLQLINRIINIAY
ncbi:MAG TPA: hypothetical protein DHU33_06340 [Firmicutes bacterium]|nr:hypothetical protein [Bacillota bacterium]